MTDFHALLKQSIIDRGISDPNDRHAIYSEARRAVVRRLWAREPALEQAQIDERINAFDSAVVDIEADLEVFFSAPKLTGPTEEAFEEDPLAAEMYEPVAGEAVDSLPPRTLQWPPQQEAYAEEEPEDLYYPETTGDPEPAYDPGYADPAGDEPNYAPDGYAAEGYAAADAGYQTSYDDELPETDYVDELDKEEPAGDERYPNAEDIFGGDMEEPLGYEPGAGYDTAFLDEAYQAPDQGDRWTAPPDDDGVRPREPQLPPPPRARSLSDRTKIQILGGAIGALVVVLGVIAALVLVRSAPEEGVTVAIDTRREISDAATAARIPTDNLDVVQSFVLFNGLDPTVFETSPDNPVRLDGDSSGRFARVSSSASASGARIVIGPGLADQLAGRRVRVRLTTRSSTERGAASMRFSYQSGFAISHWQTANLELSYAEVGLLWRVPSRLPGTPGDYLLIEPGIPGDGSGMDIRSVAIDLLAQ